MGLLLGEAVALALGVWLVAGHRQRVLRGMAFREDKGTNGVDTANPGNAGLAHFDNPKIGLRHSHNLTIGKCLKHHGNEKQRLPTYCQGKNW